MQCAVCGNEFPTTPGAGRPRRYCSVGCRQRAYRRRSHAEGGTGPPALPSGDGRPRVAVVVMLVWPDRGEAAQVAEAVSGLDLMALISRLGNGIDAAVAGADTGDTGDTGEADDDARGGARASSDADDSG